MGEIESASELSTKKKAAIVVELVRAGKLMFNRPPLSDAELETLAWKCLRTPVSVIAEIEKQTGRRER